MAFFLEMKVLWTPTAPRFFSLPMIDCEDDVHFNNQNDACRRRNTTRVEQLEGPTIKFGDILLQKQFDEKSN